MTMTTTNYIAVKADDENNADQWWDVVHATYPAFGRAMMADNGAVIAAHLWDTLAALPGFEDGPEHAPCALIDCGSEGEQWADVVAGRHQVFEELR
jgi:hypothetical protein